MAAGAGRGDETRAGGWAGLVGRLLSAEVVWLKDRERRVIRYAGAAVAVGLALLMLIGELTRLPGGEGRQGAGAVPAQEDRPDRTAARAGAAVREDMPVAVLEREMEADLERVLSRMDGVGQVQVRVSLAGGLEREYVSDRNVQRSTTQERDQNGGTRTIEQVEEADKVVAVQAGAGQDAVVRQVRRPEVRGVLVVAEGADLPAVREAVMRAVQVALDVPLYRVEVVPARPAGRGEGR